AGLYLVGPVRDRAVFGSGSVGLMLRRGRGECQDFLPNGNVRYRASFFEKVHRENAEQNKVRAGALAFSRVGLADAGVGGVWNSVLPPRAGGRIRRALPPAAPGGGRRTQGTHLVAASGAGHPRSKNLAAGSEQNRLGRIHDIRRATERLGQGRSVGAW